MMNIIKTGLMALAGLLLGSGMLSAQTSSDEVIFKALQDELTRNQQNLALPGFSKPFFISYALGRVYSFEITGTLGAITRAQENPRTSTASIRLLLGDYHFNNEFRFQGQFLNGNAPIEADYNALRRNLWLGTDVAYKNAIQNLAGKSAYLKSNPRTDEEANLDDLSKITPVTRMVEAGGSYQVDVEQWKQNVRELSAIFKNYKNLFNSSVTVGGIDMNIYKKTTEGTTLKEPVRFVNLVARATVRTDDGVMFGDTWLMVAERPGQLPSMEELKKQVTAFAENLSKLREAEPITEYYSGPILFEDEACSQVFIDNLLNQGGLFAYRRPDNGGARRTLDNRVGKKIVDSRITIKNYSTLDKYNNTPLFGAYEIDAEGVVPEKEMTLVEHGILKRFLNGRYPTAKAPVSTGSSRYVLNGSNISFTTAPGTIHISVDKGMKQEKMKKALIKAAKEEGLDYAYIVRRLAGQSSLIYKVNVKDGAETMVRAGDFSPINLQKIKRLLAISSKEKVKNYFLNQQVLSSLIYPSSILVEDVEINKSALKKNKKPALQFPLQRAAR